METLASNLLQTIGKHLGLVFSTEPDLSEQEYDRLLEHTIE